MDHLEAPENTHTMEKIIQVENKLNTNPSIEELSELLTLICEVKSDTVHERTRIRCVALQIIDRIDRTTKTDQIIQNVESSLQDDMSLPELYDLAMKLWDATPTGAYQLSKLDLIAFKVREEIDKKHESTNI